MMKKIFQPIWISIACVAVMFLTAACILAFYITLAFRKIFVKDFTPHAFKGAAEDEDVRIESATSHLNAIKATLDKTEPQRW
jgi:hypothetical protein